MTDGVVGSSYPRHEAVAKVTGKSRYTADLSLPDMVYGCIVRSPHPHARVTGIDVSSAREIPGVLGILLPEDVPQQLFNSSGNPPSSLLLKDEKILTRHPLYAGDRIAAVVGTSGEVCRRAAGEIKVHYKKLAPVFKIKEALADDTPCLHPEVYDSNIIKEITVQEGEPEQGFRESDFVFADDFYTPPCQHAALEPTSCICDYREGDKLTIYSNSQTIFQERRILAGLLDLDENDVRIIKPAMGGGFGARQQLHNQHIGALLSKLVNRPVRIINTREEEMYASVLRHETRSHLKIGVDRDGTINAFTARVYFNTGAYATHGPTVMAAASRKLQYGVPNYSYEGYCVLTNLSVSGAFRGYGNTQISFAREVFLSRVAGELEMDPVEFRLLNHIETGEKFPGTRTPISSCKIEECVAGGEKIKKKIDREENNNNPDYHEAWGTAFCCHTSGPSSNEGMSSCIITVNDDGTVNLKIGSADIGQGSETALSQLAAGGLGVDMKDITVIAADTHTTPYDTGTFGSSQMYVGGNAVTGAVRDVKEKIKKALAEKHDIEPRNISWENKRIRLNRGKDTEILSFKQAIARITFGMKGTIIIGSSSFKAEKSPPPFAVCWAKVCYNKLTETFRVKHIIQAVDVGTAINPGIVSGQIEGGIGMGYGSTIMERLEINKRIGKPVTADFLEYRVPLTVDMPGIHTHIVDSYEPSGPCGAKSVGEMPLIPVPPAIINAVNNLSEITGEEFSGLPVTDFWIPGGEDDFVAET